MIKQEEKEQRRRDRLRQQKLEENGERPVTIGTNGGGSSSTQ